MRTHFMLFIALLIASLSFAQGLGINYKAIVKDNNGNVISNQNVKLKFSILNFSDTSVYEETHTITTDANGIVIAIIGSGTENITGDFFAIDWGSNLYKLQTEIDIQPYDTFISLGITPFQSMPYANHAHTAQTADTANNVSGLEKINGNNGWRLIGRDPAYYGSIGPQAVDLSYSSVINSMDIEKGAIGFVSVTMGSNTIASGDVSTAMGSNTIASGHVSTAMGSNTIASGNRSTAMGWRTLAESNSCLAIGSHNIGGGNTQSWIPEDPLFEVGNGTNDSNRSNALTVLKNGKLITGGSLSIQDASDNTSSWQLETRPNGSLSLYRNGSYRGFFNEATGVYSSISDRKTKEDITPLDNGTLSKVMQLNPVSYLMKTQTDTKRNLGLISQEVKKIFPSITHYVEESDLLVLSYTELIPILIKALQEQQKIIETQKAKDFSQDKTIEALTARLNLLESKSSN